MRVAITTLGCKINQYDSAVIRTRLAAENYSFVPFDEKADCYIINTCTVTDRADWEARQLIRRAKRLNPESRVLVTGCYAQVSGHKVAQVPGVDFVVGLNRLDDLVGFVKGGDGSPGKNVVVGDVQKERRVDVLGTGFFPGHTRAFLKIQEGCNYPCSYCIIPTARGRSRSVPFEEVLRQVRSLAKQGFVEIVITGIHLGGYGRDLRPKADLTTLVETIATGRMIPRLRLSSLDPREVPDRLLQLIAASDIVCPHLHVCLQAGNDKILRGMRRNYDTSYYYELMTRARRLLPHAALGSDIIVGFPGESEEDFVRSLNFLKSLPLTYFHVFPYSIRTGTGAASLNQQVSLEIKKERAKNVRELGALKKKEFYRRFIGHNVSVLLESAVDKVSGAYKGYTRNYLPVLVPADHSHINHEVEVTIRGVEGAWLRGQIVGGVEN
ncbi:MAG: tRNA (N(6)-L-threonylcarbamoyladenosine(37)-C(2))-methylthiotransferase MtaB [Deltaproteobacteria bacterium]|nr:tRNA (N(6)-L-threonylcarbamoyladenosine(37)-C(2))-methylthiotransferase MtaB [Deltaproteobacteria bacterium]